MSDGFIKDNSLMAPVYQGAKMTDDEFNRIFPNAPKREWQREDCDGDNFEDKLDKIGMNEYQKEVWKARRELLWKD